MNHVRIIHHPRIGILKPKRDREGASVLGRDHDATGEQRRDREGASGLISTGQSFNYAALVKLTALTCCIISLTGCVRRSITITTEPTNALVYLNDQEIGRSSVSTDFLWYGDYDVIIRKKGYHTLNTHWKIDAPWYQWMPIDLFAEVLWPGYIHDHHEKHFTLAPFEAPNKEELLSRANELRQRALESNQ